MFRVGNMEVYMDGKNGIGFMLLSLLKVCLGMVYLFLYKLNR